jgi:hypothetical protein
MAIGTLDKAWFDAELEDVNPQARTVLETYSNIASDQVVPHVLRIVSRDMTTPPL